jgi:hypothetical protein
MTHVKKQDSKTIHEIIPFIFQFGKYCTMVPENRQIVISGLVWERALYARGNRGYFKVQKFLHKYMILLSTVSAIHGQLWS